MARTDLPHLNAHVEGVGQHANELAEVNASVGNVVENRFVAVALIFDIADFHIQLERFGDLSALDHRVVLTTAGFVPFFDVGGAGFAIHALDFAGALGLCLFHLQGHERSGERDGANVVSGRGFDGNDVAFLEVEMIIVAKISLAGVLKLHLHEIGELVVAGNVAIVVVGVELMFGAPASAGRESAECRVGNGRL